MKNETINDEILSITGDLSEVAIDSLMKDGILKDIPVVGTIFSASKLILSISDSILLSKICCFIKALEFKSEQERDDFKKKYLTVKDYQKIGSKIILFLNSADDEKKIIWLSKLLNALVDEKITNEHFLRLTMIINNSFPEYLEKISAFKNHKKLKSSNEFLDRNILTHLFSIGMLDQKSDISVQGDSGEINNEFIYSLSVFGKEFIGCCL